MTPYIYKTKNKNAQEAHEAIRPTHIEKKSVGNNPEQKALYELVLQAQQAAIDVIKPGSHWNEPHDATVKVITEGLVKLDLLKGKVSALIKEMAYRDFYMHRAGHWLGMDVHDVGDYKCGGEWRVLEAGMVFTCEPGIYIPEENLGIRLENDILVTANGPDDLMKNIPLEAEEIESLMNK